MGVELPLCVAVTILECCVMFSGVKLSIRSFTLFLKFSLKTAFFGKKSNILMRREGSGRNFSYDPMFFHRISVCCNMIEHCITKGSAVIYEAKEQEISSLVSLS